MFPQISIETIIEDLRVTGSTQATIENILEGRVGFMAGILGNDVRFCVTSECCLSIFEFIYIRERTINVFKKRSHLYQHLSRKANYLMASQLKKAFYAAFQPWLASHSSIPPLTLSFFLLF